MKKSVVLILMIIAIPLFFWLLNTGYITGLQTYNLSQLPAPPSPPGMSAGTSTPTTPTVPGTPPSSTASISTTSSYSSTSTRATSRSRGTSGRGYSRSRAILRTAEEYTFPLKIEEINRTQLLPLVYDTARRVAIIEAKLKVLDLIPEFEDEINALNDNLAQLGAIESRLQNLESKQKMSVEVPMFTENIEDVKRSLRKRTMFSMILTLLSLSLVTGLIILLLVQKKKIEKEEKETIKSYLKNYLRSGYKFETLKMHLLASGWDEDIINKAIDELKGGLKR
ncbi:hypothetical protein B6U93_02870 [Candidatus Woesearchaeota archaeon ex4484_78]|nr:MAG: hypothetical protein B6U93_02870 [Candidatus Woesearchaeota archaeon ex4484_78]